VARPDRSRLQSGQIRSDQIREECCSVVVSEGMELIIVLLVILANLGILVWIQKWSGLT
jgi:hypothetical protein